MSDDLAAFDAYRSPPIPEGPVVAERAGGRPGWLTTLCVLCIVLGAMGILNAGLSVVGVIGGKAIQSAFKTPAASRTPGGMEEVQAQLQADIQKVQDKYFWVGVPVLAFRAVAATLLLVGGVKSLSLKESGRKLLLVACAVAVTLELGQGILQSFINLEMMTVINEFQDRLASAMPKEGEIDPQAIKVIQTMVRVFVIAAMVFGYILVLLKAALYVFGLIYLRRDHIRKLFHSPTSPAATSVL
jgi:hypothetical protein